jgi:hypothetical protein
VVGLSHSALHVVCLELPFVWNMPLNLNSFQFFSELPSRHDCDCWNIRGILSAVPRLCRSAFFLLAKFRQKANFFYLWPIFGEIWTQKNIIGFSSTFRAFIQYPDELASGSVLVVPPGRKTKNHRKNTGADCQQ